HRHGRADPGQHADGGAQQHAEQRVQQVDRLERGGEAVEQEGPGVHQRPIQEVRVPVTGIESPSSVPKRNWVTAPRARPMSAETHQRFAPSASEAPVKSTTTPSGQPSEGMVMMSERNASTTMPVAPQEVPCSRSTSSPSSALPKCPRSWPTSTASEETSSRPPTA